MRKMIAGLIVALIGIFVGFGVDEWRHSNYPQPKTQGVAMKDEHSHHKYHMVLRCVDPRFGMKTDELITKECKTPAYTLTWRGASKGINDVLTTT